jgi:hypothetical protein
LPTPAEDLCLDKVPALDRLRSSPELGVVVGIIPTVAPPAGDAAGREGHIAAVLPTGGHQP